MYILNDLNLITIIIKHKNLLLCIRRTGPIKTDVRILFVWSQVYYLFLLQSNTHSMPRNFSLWNRRVGPNDVKLFFLSITWYIYLERASGTLTI